MRNLGGREGGGEGEGGREREGGRGREREGSEGEGGNGGGGREGEEGGRGGREGEREKTREGEKNSPHLSTQRYICKTHQVMNTRNPLNAHIQQASDVTVSHDQCQLT